MRILDGRTCAVLALIAIGLVAGCASVPWRDFASVTRVPAASVAAPSAPELLEPSAEPPKDLGPLLAPFAAESGIPGMGAAVLSGNRIVGLGVTGVRRKGTAERITPDDRFHIASCAKAMSAMVLARLVERGTLAWDRPLASYFPGETIHPEWERVSLRHLLTHTAGVRDPLWGFLASTYFRRGTPAERRRALVRDLLRDRPAAGIRTEAEYGNMGFILLAAAAESVAAQPWEQLMYQHVFQPLGLESAGFGPPGEPGAVREPWGHGKHRMLQIGLFGNAAFDPAARSADYPALASPAGYVHVSLRDWAAFAALHLRAHPANPNRAVAVLRSETADVLYDLRPGSGYSAGWFIATRPWAKGPRPEDVGRVLFHVGDNGRFTSVAWLAPEIDFAVLVTCNRGDQAASLDDVVARLVEQYARAR